MANAPREGSLEAPTRHPLDWRNPGFFDEDSLFKELERVFDICHGCRRCVSLCRAFPTLFDLVDESETMEVDGVDKDDYWKVVDHCYLCDLCYLTKCPYVPPHEWGLDFPHLMLRAKACKFRRGETKRRDTLLTDTDTIGKYACLPVVATVVNGANRLPAFRSLLDSTLGVHPEARLPEYHSDTLRKRAARKVPNTKTPMRAGPTTGRVALFATCYANCNEPAIGEDLIAVFEHNDIPMILATGDRCCGMPKLELGDLAAVETAKKTNIPVLAGLVDEGFDIVAAVPSCVLMFKQEIPLMFPNDVDVDKVKSAIFDPFEYLMHRRKADLLRTDFRLPLGKVAYHVACHQRVQKIGLKTREILSLIPGTRIHTIERCSGHDGTYAVKSEFRADSMKIVKPVTNRVKQSKSDFFASDCPMAGQHIASDLDDGSEPMHPLSLLRKAYGI